MASICNADAGLKVKEFLSVDVRDPAAFRVVNNDIVIFGRSRDSRRPMPL